MSELWTKPQKQQLKTSQKTFMPLELLLMTVLVTFLGYEIDIVCVLVDVGSILADINAQGRQARGVTWQFGEGER